MFGRHKFDLRCGSPRVTLRGSGDTSGEPKAYDWRMGRKKVVPETVRRRVLGLRLKGLSWSEVADQLNAWRIPTGQGGARWYSSTARGLALRGVQELGRCPKCGRELRP
jgi:hypothetical protein